MYYVMLLIIKFSFFFAGLGTAAIRNVSLLVDPPAVRRGQHATLRCLYNLEGAPLYSVKFYRGLREFYRYSPSEVPSSKTFPFPGIYVDVSSCCSHPYHLYMYRHLKSEQIIFRYS